MVRVAAHQGSCILQVDDNVRLEVELVWLIGYFVGIDCDMLNEGRCYLGQVQVM